MISKEHERLAENKDVPIPRWYRWGPYVAERAWGTVREDYSWNGDAWNYFPFDKAASKVYRWGEDGIAGWCDRYQTLIFAPAFWNGHDPILKERLFGLNSFEGNHGEDVKEYYFHLDALPSHAYMQYLYKYPQHAFPYAHLQEESRKKGNLDPEYELIDTGIFSDNRYFDIFIEYAKAAPDDICIKIEVCNRASQTAPIHVIPQLWFRNQWAWGDQKLPEPTIVLQKQHNLICLVADDTQMLSPTNLLFDYHLGKRFFYGAASGQPLFTSNEDSYTGGQYRKDAFHRAILHKEHSVNPKQEGTKACIDYFCAEVPAKGSITFYFRLTDQERQDPLGNIEAIIQQRKKEADEFYAQIHPPLATEDEKLIQRQALAGMIWSKQIYLFDVNVWLEGDNSYSRPAKERYQIRNNSWRHLNSMRILSMPDKWEYPWFAAWDLAFHCISFALVDIQFAKEQLWLLLFDQFQHPNGQIPAYEWDFSDLNPPIQAWTAWQLYNIEKERWGKKDRDFLKRCFDKLLINFAWWVNKVDSAGHNVFEGGFLGLDNISLIDRSEKFEGGVRLEQSDGTGWMAFFCLNLMRIALELAKQDSTFEVLATKFFQHFVYIAYAVKHRSGKAYELWDEVDGFFYDVLSYPDGAFAKFRVRSLVGIIPIFAVEILRKEESEIHSEFWTNFQWFLKNRKKLVGECVIPLEGGDFLLSLVEERHLSRVLQYIWDPAEFRAPYGVRSLSRYHQQNPFVFKDKQIGYEPSEAVHKVKGGNSNWRGPIWFCPNYLLIVALRKFFLAYQDRLKIMEKDETLISIDYMMHHFANSLILLYAKTENGIRPFRGQDFPFMTDPYWQDYLLFHEYFNPDTGKGLGASHQTGWTGLIANLIDEFRR